MDLSNERDIDESMHGPVYQVCGVCRKRYDDEIQKELDYYDNGYDDFIKDGRG